MRLPLLLLSALVFLIADTSKGHGLSTKAGALTVAASPSGFTARGDAERMIDKRFDVAPGDKLVVDVGHADVDIQTTSADEARVEVFLEGRDMQRARRFFEALRFEVEQQGNTVSVTTNQRPSVGWSFDRNGRAHVFVRITIPEHFDARIEVAHGNLTMGSLTGEVDLQMSHGNAHVEALRGEELRFETAHGDLRTARIEGRTVVLHASHGDLDLGAVVAQDLEAEIAHGNIEIDELEGRAEVAGAHGNIDVRLAKSGGLRVHNSHGNVTLVLPPDHPGELRLTASKVRLASSLAFEGTVRDNRADGRINGGGPMLEAHISHGNLTLRTH